MKFNLRIKKIFGFSLIEIMVSLIVIAIVTAAFAPIISKKMQDHIVGGSDKVNFNVDCSAKFSTNCSLCDGTTKCLDCNLECTKGKYQDPINCKCVSCTTTYGSTCTQCNYAQCLSNS